MTDFTFPTQKLTDWFLQNKRTLPWREKRDPYAIWISEVMLQQTQVKTALPYFQRWMERFPTLESLAKAPIDEVIKLWEGLGYYSRARNLHRGAQEISLRFKGQIPSSTEELLSIKGIGPYTKGAIQSFAFHKRSTLIDGNVKRVLSRFYDLDVNLDLPKNYRGLEEVIERILPIDQPWVFNEALMELGALVCTPKTPDCPNCPLLKECKAQKNKTVALRPVRSDRKKRILLFRVVFVCHHNDHFLVKKRDEGIMQDLYELPYEPTEHQTQKDIKPSHIFSKFLKKTHLNFIELPKVTHSFTHHHVTLFPFQVDLKSGEEISGYEWSSREEMIKKPFSSGYKKILKLLGLTV